MTSPEPNPSSIHDVSSGTSLPQHTSICFSFLSLFASFSEELKNKTVIVFQCPSSVFPVKWGKRNQNPPPFRHLRTFQEFWSYEETELTDLNVFSHASPNPALLAVRGTSPSPALSVLQTGQRDTSD